MNTVILLSALFFPLIYLWILKGLGGWMDGVGVFLGGSVLFFIFYLANTSCPEGSSLSDLP